MYGGRWSICDIKYVVVGGLFVTLNMCMVVGGLFVTLNVWW